MVMDIILFFVGFFVIFFLVNFMSFRFGIQRKDGKYSLNATVRS